MAGATYRFEMRAARSDGSHVVLSRGAAVYATPEEALLQAATDEALGGNVHPLDVVDGEHHGYQVTAFGEAADPADEEHVRAAAEWDEPAVLAGRKAIGQGAGVVRELWMHPDHPESLMADESLIEPMPVEARRAAAKVTGNARFADHEARATETLRRLREMLS